jgi:hypothetical protein
VHAVPAGGRHADCLATDRLGRKERSIVNISHGLTERGGDGAIIHCMTAWTLTSTCKMLAGIMMSNVQFEHVLNL